MRTVGDNEAFSNAKRRLTNYHKQLKQKAKRQYQESWIQERRDRKILTRGKEAAQDHRKTDFVQCIWLLIPERGRLAQKMASDRPLDDNAMWDALQDLYSLCVQDFTILYLPNSHPIKGAYPAKCC